jgi:Archaeal IMP cyclohydrolase
VSNDEAVVGVVRRDALLVERVDAPTLVATYEKDAPEPYDLSATDAEAAASEVLAADFEHPVCAAGATVGTDGVSLAVDNGDAAE